MPRLKGDRPMRSASDIEDEIQLCWRRMHELMRDDQDLTLEWMLIKQRLKDMYWVLGYSHLSVEGIMERLMPRRRKHD